MGAGTREAARLAEQQEDRNEALIKRLRRGKERLVRALKSEDSTLQQKLIAELMEERDEWLEGLRDVQAILWGVNPDVQKALDRIEELKLKGV